EAGDHPGPCGVLQGPHRSPDARRSGHAGRRQVRAAAPIGRLKGNRDVVLIRDLTAQRGRATRKAADAAGRRNRRRAALGGRAPRRAACRRRPARFASRSRSRVARRSRDRSRLSAARQSDDREGGLRAPADVLPRRVLRVEVAAQPAHVHAPRAQLRARVSFPDAVRVPDCANWQRRSALVHHPLTGQQCWFNQIAFLNEWTMDPEVREYLVDIYGEDGLPFNTRFGNGDPIGADFVQLLDEVYEANTTRERWQAGDLLLVDNIRTAHARESFAGPREVVVALADPVRLAG